MCGILAVAGARKSLDSLKLETLTLQRLVRHRGPDGSGIHCIDNGDGTSTSIAHERLAIMDPLSGNQPLFSQDKTLSLAVNGEIYNFKDLRARVNDESRFRTGSDCEPIVHLYEQVGNDVAAHLDGDFAFVILNEQTGSLYAARDPMGVNSLYWGTGLDGATWFASEAKPLLSAGCIDIEQFPPGHYYSSTNNEDRTPGRAGQLVRYYKPAWYDVKAAKDIFRVGGQMYKALSEEDKKKWQAKYQEEMKAFAEKVVVDALGQFSVEEEIAGYIKEQFDTSYQPSWHCTVGRRFGTYVTHETKNYIFMSVGNLYILLYKCGKQEGLHF